MPTTDVLTHYLPDHPLMAQAWVDCLRWAIGEPGIIEAFKADTGMHWRPGRTPIERMIDDATGVGEAFIRAFVPWFHANIWGDEDASPSA